MSEATVKGGADPGALPSLAASLYPTRAESVGFCEPLPKGRMLLHLAREGVISASSAEIACRITMATADLSILNSGRAPLLIGHLTPLEFLAGVIEEAWIVEGILLARARLAKTPRMAEARALIKDRILVNCSVGMILNHAAEPDGEGVHAVTRWRPYEASLCTLPRPWAQFRPR